VEVRAKVREMGMAMGRVMEKEMGLVRS